MSNVLVGHLKPSNTLLYRIEPAERFSAVSLDVDMQLLQARGHVVHAGRQTNHSIPAFPAAGAKSTNAHGSNCDGCTYDSSSNLDHGRGKTYEQRIERGRRRYRPCPLLFLWPGLALLCCPWP